MCGNPHRHSKCLAFSRHNQPSCHSEPSPPGCANECEESTLTDGDETGMKHGVDETLLGDSSSVVPNVT